MPILSTNIFMSIWMLLQALKDSIEFCISKNSLGNKNGTDIFIDLFI